MSKSPLPSHESVAKRVLRDIPETSKLEWSIGPGPRIYGYLQAMCVVEIWPINSRSFEYELAEPVRPDGVIFSRQFAGSLRKALVKAEFMVSRRYPVAYELAPKIRGIDAGQESGESTRAISPEKSRGENPPNREGEEI